MTQTGSIMPAALQTVIPPAEWSLHQPVVEWAERTGARIVSPQGASGSGILCVAPEGVQEAHRRLKAARIVCSLREGAIRLSPHCYNTVAEMERVAHALAAD